MEPDLLSLRRPTDPYTLVLPTGKPGLPLGVYVFRLTVTERQTGNTGTASISITVAPGPRIVSFTLSSSSIIAHSETVTMAMNAGPPPPSLGSLR
eukprot:1330560-Amorphochlora_amoeboformis.AAC.1